MQCGYVTGYPHASSGCTTVPRRTHRFTPRVTHTATCAHTITLEIPRATHSAMSPMSRRCSNIVARNSRSRHT
eukprot:3629302-Rhodomonas_salina.2